MSLSIGGAISAASLKFGICRLVLPICDQDQGLLYWAPVSIQGEINWFPACMCVEYFDILVVRLVWLFWRGYFDYMKFKTARRYKLPSLPWGSDSTTAYINKFHLYKLKKNYPCWNKHIDYYDIVVLFRIDSTVQVTFFMIWIHAIYGNVNIFLPPTRLIAYWKNWNLVYNNKEK